MKDRWIELNLPWRVPTPSILHIDPPNLDQEIRNIFGATEKDLVKQLFTTDSPYFTEHPSWVSFRQVEDDIEREVSKQCSHLSTGEQRLETLNRLAQSADPGVKSVLEYRARRLEIYDWYDTQPVVVVWREETQIKYDAAKALHKTLCFSAMDEAQPGTLIEVKSDGKLHHMLIGNINSAGGVCDDCRGIEDHDIITRYRVIWRNENESRETT